MLQVGIEQSFNSTGTVTFTLVAPTDSLRISFVAGVGAGNTAWYRAEGLQGSADQGQWEEGWGTVTSGSPDTLTRNVVRSSNANALVNWSVGTKRIYGCLLSEAVRFGAAGQLPTAGGTANARTLAYNPPARVLRPSMEFAFLNGAAANTGAATLAIDALSAASILRPDGTALQAGDLPLSSLVVVRWDGTAFRLASAPVTITPGADGAWTDIASATTTDIGAVASANLRVTGTTTITGLGTVASGTRRKLRFAGVLTFTHNGTSLILPGAANITTAADDVAEAVSLGSGNWIVVAYQRANGRAVIGIASSALTATTSGTSVDVTGIPSGVKRITIALNGVSTNGTSFPILQLGDSGGVETTGYLGTGGGLDAGNVNASLSTTGFLISRSAIATLTRNGVITLILLDAATNSWVCSSVLGDGNTAFVSLCGGSKALSAVLDRIRLTTAGGTDTFDAGSMTVHWEF